VDHIEKGYANMNWIEMAQGRIQWQLLWWLWWTFQFKTAGKFLFSWMTATCSLRTL